jgi:2-keto-4-pentenoate hydratase
VKDAAAFEAAEFLQRLCDRSERVDALPEALRPRNRGEGYAVQSVLESRSTSPLFGWKLAATSKAGQDHIRVDAPLVGRLFREQVIADGANYCALERNLMRVAELEFAFRFARDITPREDPWSTATALAEVETLHPAIELPDSRFNRYESVGAPQLIADNACAHCFVLGKAAPDGWRTLDLSKHEPWGCIDGKHFRKGSGSNVLGDPCLALVWFLDEASRYRITVRAGEIVTTGTCLQPIPIAPGTIVSGDFGVLGTVSVRIA